MTLPALFVEKMKAMLGPEYPDFLAGYEKPPYKGVRLNPLKCTPEQLQASLPFPLEPSPFSPLSYYAPEGWKPGATPAHHAGMFYSQEPSAASAVTALDPQPGERILDLCAAPGGKSTQIAGLLGRQGLLWSNEVVRSRANILLSNMERLGVQNAVVSSAQPALLCGALRGWFHRVLVDAPCSGEGMFRRDPAAIEAWSQEGVESCARRQLLILDSAAQAVREGGLMVYSTCTFSREENEDVCARFLQAHPEFTAEPIPAAFGRPALDGSPARRVLPIDGGEGHFVARFRRVGENPCSVLPVEGQPIGNEARQAVALYEECFCCDRPGSLGLFGGRVFLLPPGLPGLSGLGVLRAGVELAAVKGKRLQPSHGIFMSRSMGECRQIMNFSPEDTALLAFLHGEEIDSPCKGYTAVCVNGIVTGFGKASAGRLKNHYPKGLRLHG